jgi:hypothetical protein
MRVCVCVCVGFPTGQTKQSDTPTHQQKKKRKKKQMHTDAPTFFFLVVVSNKTKQISKSISTGKRKENSTFSKTISINNIRERARSTHTLGLT